MKRALDLIGSIVGLALLWPFLLLSAVFIKSGSPGPVIFAQRRLGRSGEPFTCYKLRSMFVDTQETGTHNIDSSSITPFGQLIRRTKIDEIPQLYNVLMGDMSLVGPRPCLPSQTRLVEARRRAGAFDLRPGITGLAQVNGIDMSEPDRLASLDGQYVRTRSNWGDIKILFATLFMVVPRREVETLPTSTGDGKSVITSPTDDRV